MAEILGVVSSSAGIASLAIQLGDSALKLRHFYTSYRHAPTTLQDTAYEIETFQLLFQAVTRERQRADSSDYAFLDRCISICVRGAERISLTVDKLEALMQRSRTRGKFRAAIEEKELRQLCSDLDRATSSLVLAYQLFSENQRNRAITRHDRAIMRQLPSAGSDDQPGSQVIVATATSGQRSSFRLADYHCEPHTCASRFSYRSSTSKDSNGHARQSRKRWPRVTLRMSPIFAALSFHVSLQTTFSGWSLLFSTSYRMPADSPIFMLAERGDLSAIKEAFSRQLVTPNVYRDVGLDGYDHDLLTISMRFGHTNLFRFLDETIRPSGTTLGYLPMLTPWRNWAQTRLSQPDLAVESTLHKDQEIYHRLLQDSGLDLEDITRELDQYEAVPQVMDGQLVFHCSRLWFSDANAESLQIIKNSLLEPYNSLPLSTRFDIAMTLQAGLVFDPQCFLQAVGINGINHTFAELESSKGQNALHFIALQLKNIVSWEPAVHFVRDLLEAGADIHKQDNHGCTPLQYFLRSQSQYPSWEPLSLWASLIKAAGIDLCHYGQREKTLWMPYRMDALFNKVLDDGENAHLTAQDITVGPRPGDWDVLICESARTQMYDYKTAPGSWPLNSAQSLLPSTICWKPDREDLPFVHWAATRRIDHGVTRYLASSCHSTRTGEMTTWQTCQDDIGPVTLAMSEPSIRRDRRRRATSQPPLGRVCAHTKTYRQSYSFFRFPNDRASINDWLWEYDDHYSHICTLGSPKRLICSASSEMNPARCLQGFNDKSLLWDAIDRNIQAARRKHLRNVKADMFKREHNL